MMFGGSHLEVGDNALAGWPTRQRCERGHGIMVMAVNGFNGIQWNLVEFNGIWWNLCDDSGKMCLD